MNNDCMDQQITVNIKRMDASTHPVVVRKSQTVSQLKDELAAVKTASDP